VSTGEYLEHLDVADQRLGGQGGHLLDTAMSGTMRYTYRISRCRINACMSSNGTASVFRPVRMICSALPNIR
jgi:hypothetical protein